VIIWIATILELTSADHWDYMAVNKKPTDLVNQGMSDGELGEKLWWMEPPWISVKDLIH